MSPATVHKKGIVERVFSFALPRPKKAKATVVRPEHHLIDREMRTAFVKIHGADGTVPSKGIYKIRNGEQCPWRVMLRRLFEAKEAGASRDDVVGVVRTLEREVDEKLFGSRST